MRLKVMIQQQKDGKTAPERPEASEAVAHFQLSISPRPAKPHGKRAEPRASHNEYGQALERVGHHGPQDKKGADQAEDHRVPDPRAVARGAAAPGTARRTTVADAAEIVVTAARLVALA